MLRGLKDLEHYSVRAADGDIGRVERFLLDDQRWAVRYVVVRTGGLLDRREVLVSPISFRQADWSTKTFHLSLTIDKVNKSPDVDVDAPVSRQHEREQARYYEYAPYWGYPGLWGMQAFPYALSYGDRNDEPRPIEEPPPDLHLRSSTELRGYHVQGRDEAIGHIEDFLVDDATWEAHYLVIDTSNWWFGRRVLVAPHWASRVSWEERKVYVDMSREAIGASPTWDPRGEVQRAYEQRLYDHYGRPAYWSPGADR